MTTDLAEANSQLEKAWRRFSRSFPGRDLGQLPGLTLAWGNVPYFAYNAIMLAEPVVSREDLEERGARAADYIHNQRRMGILIICDDWIPDGAGESLRRFGFEPGWKMTGMVADRLLEPVREFPPLEIRRVSDAKTLVDLYDINSAGYALDRELARASTGPVDDWEEGAFGYVAYLGDEPVASAATFALDGRLYVGMVATMPHAQRRGYAEAVMRHSLEHASTATGLRRTVLHASDEGLSIYLRMGYRATAHFMVYTRQSARSARFPGEP
jgi:GNAT superfamily N-acetyltransferase